MRMLRPRFGLCLGVCLLVPAVATATSDGPPIGVSLLENPRQVQLAADDDCVLIFDGEREKERGAGGSDYRIVFDGNVAILEPLRFDGRPFRARAVSPEGEPRVITVEGRFGGSSKPQRRKYEGWIEFLPPTKDRGWRVTNRLPMERYLAGVIGWEMGVGPEVTPTALEAQAIVSRTYAMFQFLSRSPSARWHVYGSTRSQVYNGAQPYDRDPKITPEEARSKVERAIAATRGQLLFFDGKVFETFFHSTCGGSTSDGPQTLGTPDIEPLHPVQCGYCNGTRFSSWNGTITEREIREELTPICARNGIALGPISAIDPIQRGPGGHAAYVRVTHSDGSFELDGVRFRLRLLKKLRSTAFECRKDGREFVFRGRGWGHGVGMCQMGARELARRGIDAVGIVQHYFGGSRVLQLWQ